MIFRKRTPKEDNEALDEAVREEMQKKTHSIMIVKIILTALFAAFSIAFWVIFYLNEFRGLALSMSVTRYFNLYVYLIPMIALIAIIFQFFFMRLKQNTKSNRIILSVLVFILICSIADTYYTSHGVNTGVVSPISEKVDDNGKYYIVLNNQYNGKTYKTKLKCSKDIYDSVIVDNNVAYSYEYSWNTLIPEIGYLLNFDLDSYCDNRNNWLENYFKEQSKNELSKAQLNIIKGSATATNTVSEDAGVKITLDSVMGNGYYSYYKLDIVLPEGMNAGEGLTFESFRLLLNDENAGLGSSGGSFTETLEDGNTKDNRFSILIGLHFNKHPLSPDYAFNNGIVRTLHFENIQDYDNAGKYGNVIEGTWDFGIIFNDEGKQVELLDKPITVSGNSPWHNFSFEAEITSFVVSEFSVNCQYKLSPNSESGYMAISPIAVMKDGREIRANGGGGGSTSYSYGFAVPVPLDEIDYIKLTDDVILKMK